MRSDCNGYEGRLSPDLSQGLNLKPPSLKLSRWSCYRYGAQGRTGQIGFVVVVSLGNGVDEIFRAWQGW